MRSAAVAVLLGLAASAAAADAPLQAFDVARAEGWPRALALCDVASFLKTKPDLDADVILARDDRSGWLRPLHGPRFLPPGLFYDEGVRRAFYRLKAAREVDRRSFAAARADIAREMLPRFRRFTAGETACLREQVRLCDALRADVASRYPAGARAQPSP